MQKRGTVVHIYFFKGKKCTNHLKFSFATNIVESISFLQHLFVTLTSTEMSKYKIIARYTYHCIEILYVYRRPSPEKCLLSVVPMTNIPIDVWPGTTCSLARLVAGFNTLGGGKTGYRK